MSEKYQFFFVGGTCGSFVQSIFYFYLYKKNKRTLNNLLVNPVTGDCHTNDLPIHFHFYHELDLTKPSSMPTSIPSPPNSPAVPCCISLK